MRAGTTISINWWVKAKRNGCWLQTMDTLKENRNPRDFKIQMKAFKRKWNQTKFFLCWSFFNADLISWIEMYALTSSINNFNKFTWLQERQGVVQAGKIPGGMARKSKVEGRQKHFSNHTFFTLRNVLLEHRDRSLSMKMQEQTWRITCNMTAKLEYKRIT